MRGKKRGGLKARRRVVEYSKCIVGTLLALYVLGVLVGGVVVAVADTSQLYAWLAYIGAPTSAGLAFYFWKAKAENIAKHKWDWLKQRGAYGLYADEEGDDGTYG